MKCALPNTEVLEGRFPKILTRNLTPGKTFFDNEFLHRRADGEWRELDPKHSKLGAALMKGCQQFGLKEGSVVLYLGSSHGYTPSFISDMVGKDGLIYCVDIAPVVMRDLVFIARDRPNMVPVLASATDVHTLARHVTAADVVFQDIAQREQLETFLKNCELFLVPGGFGMLSLKAGSMDVARRPIDIFKEVRKRLETTPWLVIVDYRELDPFERDHAFFVVKRRG